jgi:XRE family transcriptional regulator, master regulator for biofilm formation
MLGKRIKELRREKNLTLSQLSRKARVSKSYLSQLERNIQTNPSIEVLMKLARVLEVTIPELIESANSASKQPDSEEMIKDWNDLIKSGLKAGIIDEKFLGELLNLGKNENANGK